MESQRPHLDRQNGEIEIGFANVLEDHHLETHHAAPHGAVPEWLINWYAFIYRIWSKY